MPETPTLADYLWILKEPIRGRLQNDSTIFLYARDDDVPSNRWASLYFDGHDLYINDYRVDVGEELVNFLSVMDEIDEGNGKWVESDAWHNDV